MDIEMVRNFCLNKKGVSEGFPFNETTLVFKVMDKIFALLNLEFPHTINLKCDPIRAIELRENHEEIIPGYHMNKKHWNTLDLTGTLSDKLVFDLIDHSYDLVTTSLPKKVQKELGNL
jgi:predicted DNA-binding protein (MmcQ/YjbR family)